MTVDSLTLTLALPELRRPFTPQAVNFKIQTNPRNAQGSALIVAYMDSRMCAERLNTVVGERWSDSYAQRDGASVVCRLRVFDAIREDVGWTRDVTSDMGVKALYSDAFKRACVKYGVGSYLYAMPKMYVPARELKESANGKSWYLTDQATNGLRRKYVQWLGAQATEKQFGKPLDHGDADDAQGDVDAAVAPEPVAAAPERSALDVARDALHAAYAEVKPTDDQFVAALDEAQVPDGESFRDRVGAAEAAALNAAALLLRDRAGVTA